MFTTGLGVKNWPKPFPLNVDDKNNIQYVLRADEMTQYIVVNDTNVQIYCEWGTGTRTATVMIAS